MSDGADIARSDDASEGDETRAHDSRDVGAALSIIVIGTVSLVVLALNDGGVIDIAGWWSTLPRWWLNDGWPWTSGWLTSPGFGGLAAVLAAALALAGARHQARLNAWWQRVEWALGLYVKPDAVDFERSAGAAALEYLSKSRLARDDERAFLADVMVSVTFDPFGDGPERDDWGSGDGEDPEPSVPSPPPPPSRHRSAHGRHLVEKWRILVSRSKNGNLAQHDTNGGPA